MSVEFHVAEFVNHEQIDPPITGDGASEVLFISCLNEFVHESGGEGVFDSEALLGRSCSQADEEVALARAGVADQAKWLAAADPVAGRESVYGRGVDVRVGVEVEVTEPLVPREPGCLDASDRGAAVAVIALRQQQLCEEPLIGQLLLLRSGGRFVDDGADGWKAKPPAGLVIAAFAASSVSPLRLRRVVVMLVVAVMILFLFLPGPPVRSRVFSVRADAVAGRKRQRTATAWCPLAGRRSRPRGQPGGAG